MPSLCVYSIPGSPFLASVLWTLEERQVPYTFVPLKPGETKQPEHLARHPFGRMPVIEHEGFTLYETQAILRYVADTFPGEALVPASLRDQARMNQQIGINDWYLFPKAGSMAVFERLVKPRLFGQPADEAIVEAVVPMAVLCATEIERLMDGRPFLAGERLSLADLHLAPQFHYLGLTPEGRSILDQRPQLAAWLQSMRSRPTIRKTLLFGLDAP